MQEVVSLRDHSWRYVEMARLGTILLAQMMAAWEMGLLTPEDWKGKWISTADANEVESGSYEFASQLPG